MQQIIRTVMPLNDGSIDSEGNFHNGDSVNAASEDVMTPVNVPSTDVTSDYRGCLRATPPFCCPPLLGDDVAVGRAALLERVQRWRLK